MLTFYRYYLCCPHCRGILEAKMTPEEALEKIEEMIAEAERNRQGLEGITGGEQPGIWWAGRAKALREVWEILLDCSVTVAEVV